MAIVLCKFEGCDREVRTMELCDAHYKQQWRGRVLTPLRDTRTVLWRLDKYTNKNGPKGCWLWEGAKAKEGYGVMHAEGRVERVHRLSYTRHKGDIPEGMFIDHRCHVRRCLNPAHLRLATPGENMQNKSGPPSDNTSGYIGVSYVKNRGMYRARINLEGKEYALGHFPTAELAWEARKAKELELFSHSPLHETMVG